MRVSVTGGCAALMGKLSVLVMVAVGAGLLIPNQAVATVPRAAPAVDQVRRQVVDLQTRAEAATERYDAAQESLASLNVRLTAAQKQVAEQRAAIDVARRALGKIAAQTYKAGDLGTLSLVFGDDPSKSLDANGLMVSLGNRKAQALATLNVQRQQLVATITDVQSQEQLLQQTQAQRQQDKATVEQELAAANTALGRLTGGQRNQLTRESNAGYRTSLGGLGITLPVSGRPTCSDVPMGTVSVRAAKAIAYACAQLGAPYLWAGAGPSSFDCSGLTLMAWKQASVSLPHNAAMQVTYGTPVAASNLQAGDLVFFDSPIGHVGIYLGEGVMIDAPHSGDVVKITPLKYFGGYVGAVRL
jgi:cell wall-associated NlpC family hydrolase